MNGHIIIFGVQLPSWIVLPVIYFIWVTALLFIKNMVFKAIKRVASISKNQLYDLLIRSIDFPLLLLIFTSGGAIVEQLMPATINSGLTNFFLIGFKAATIIAIILFADKFLNGLIVGYADQVEILRTSGGIARGAVRVVVISLGLLILLDNFGVSITPVLASLGIGSLAVALALQPTLENFFAGIQLVADRPIKVGHYVKLESGEEGYINKIGWRSTWLRMLNSNIVVIPNVQMINSRITNFYYPDKELAISVDVGVHYESDLEKVERVTVEVARETLSEVAGGVKNFEPSIRYHTFDAYSINFSVNLRVKEYVDNYLIKHEFIKRLHRRYAKEGIIIPYPIQAVNYLQEKMPEEGKRF